MTSKEEKALQRLQTRCFEVSCEMAPCLLICVSSDISSRYCSCLLHYVGQQDADFHLSSGSVSVFDQERLRSQTPQVNELWKEVVADVILDMYDLQKQEEEKLRKDPLSILSLNRPSQTKTLAREHGHGAAERALDRGESIQGKKRKSLSLKSNTKKKQNALDPFRRIQSNQSENLLSGIGGGEEDEETETMEERNLRLEKEEKEANGMKCEACGSQRTVTRLVELVENSRSETWGFKDAPTTYNTTCKKCDHVQSFAE